MRPSAYIDVWLPALASVLAEKQHELIKLEEELAAERNELSTHKTALLDAVGRYKAAELERDELLDRLKRAAHYAGHLSRQHPCLDEVDMRWVEELEKFLRLAETVQSHIK